MKKLLPILLILFIPLIAQAGMLGDMWNNFWGVDQRVEEPTLGATLLFPHGINDLRTISRGDVIIATTSHQLYGVATGTEGHVLTITSGFPAWVASAGGAAGSGQWSTTTENGIYFLYDVWIGNAVSSSAEFLFEESSGNLTITGDYSGANLSGSNTGDQDLSGYYLGSFIDTNFLATGTAASTYFTIAGANASNTAWLTDTTYTEEEIQDLAFATIFDGTETLISVTYDDAGDDIDFVVDSDLHKYSWTNVTSTDIPDNVIVAGHFAHSQDWGEIVVGGAGQIALDSSCVSAAEMAEADHGEIKWDAAHNATLDYTEVTLADFTNDANYATTGVYYLKTEIDASSTSWLTDTQLTQAQVEDYAGGLWTGNTETLITITYQGGDNTLDAVVNDDLSQYSNATSGFLTSETDPVWNAASSSFVLWASASTSNWDAAHGWGDHSGAGYLTTITPEDLTVANATTDEYVLSYEATGNTFEWKAAGADTFAGFEIDGASQTAVAPTLDFDGTTFSIVEDPANDFDININKGNLTEATSSVLTITGGTSALLSAASIWVDTDLHNWSWTNVVDADITNTLTCSTCTGNAGTASALAANGANATSGWAIIGVDASGAYEGAFDVWTESENTVADYFTTAEANASNTAWLADNNTTYSGGTNLTLDGTTFNVDDAFIKLGGDSTGALTSDLNIDANTLVVDYDTNEVGIGIADPLARLHVYYPTSGDVFFQVQSGDGGGRLKTKYGYNGYGWYYDYRGDWSGDNNEWQLWSEGAGTDDMQVYGIKQSGNITFQQNMAILGTLTLPTTYTGVLRTDSGVVSTTSVGSGTVTSVDFSVPTGLTIANNPITTSGTLALDYDAGYAIPLSASTTEGSTAFGWGDWRTNIDISTDTNLSTSTAGISVIGDNVGLVLGAIDHDALLNYVAEEHVDWAGAAAGTIHTDNYVENPFGASIGVAELTAEDFGDFTVAASLATLDASTVSDNEIDYTNVTLADFTNDGDYATSGQLHAAVTLAGQDYLTLSTQQITAGEIQPDDLASSDFGFFTCNGSTCSLDIDTITPAHMSVATTNDEYVLTYEATGDTWEWQAAGSGDITDVFNCDTGDCATITMGAADSLDCSAGDIILNTLSVDAGTYAAGSIDGDDMNSNFAGAYLTETAGSPDTLGVDAEIYTESFSMVSEATSTYNGSIQHSLPNAITISKIKCFTDAGTCTIQLDERGETTPTSGGTDVMSAQLVCATTLASTTAFANSGIAADAWINLDIDAVSSATSVTINVEYIITD